MLYVNILHTQLCVSCNALIRNKNLKINEKLIFHNYIRYVNTQNISDVYVFFKVRQQK